MKSILVLTLVLCLSLPVPAPADGGAREEARRDGPTSVAVTSEPFSAGAACVAEFQLSHEEGCGAFAAMLSDYVFGPSSNPARRLEDNAQVRPGDIVFRVNPDGSAAHVGIAMTTAHDEGGIPSIRTADGNVNGAVQWFDTVSNYPTRVNGEPLSPGGSIRVIYTRYPA